MPRIDRDHAMSERPAAGAAIDDLADSDARRIDRRHHHDLAVAHGGAHAAPPGTEADGDPVIEETVDDGREQASPRESRTV